MCAKGFLKRFLPFFLTFAAGLFIASFFVNIAAPSVGFRNRGLRRCQAFQQIRMQNQDLRDENQRLKDELDMLRRAETDVTVPFDAPVPPPPPRTVATKHFR